MFLGLEGGTVWEDESWRLRVPEAAFGVQLHHSSTGKPVA